MRVAFLTIVFAALGEQAVVQETVTSFRWRRISQGYDFCAEPDKNSDDVDRYLADRSSIKPQMLKLPKERTALTVQRPPERIHIFGEGNFAQKYLRVVLVPIGYAHQKLSSEMEQLVTVARAAFAGVPELSFAYVYPAYNMSFFHVERLVILDGPMYYQLMTGPFVSLAQADGVIFILNTKEYVASAGRDAEHRPWAVASGKDGFSRYSLIHEIGHMLGLGDGYSRYYRSAELPGTELFYGQGRWPPYIGEIYTSLAEPPAVVYAGRCGQESIYRFHGSSQTVMAADPTLDNEFNASGAFSEIQKRVMNRFIRNYLEKRLK